MIKAGDYIGYCTNGRLIDRVDRGFVVCVKGNAIQVIHVLDRETRPEDKEYLFNNPIEYWTGWINITDLK